MTARSQKISPALQPTNCVSYRLRRAARVAGKAYDAALRPVGLRNTQFTMLASLDRFGPSSIGDLAERLATDATTLTRNLDVLVRRGLVEDIVAAAEDARVRTVGLTAPGEKIYREALPLWRQAQKHILGAVGSDRWTAMRGQLVKIEAACDGSEK